MSHSFLSVSPEEYARAVKLSGEVLEQARSTLRMNLRFLDGALNRLRTCTHPQIVFATDGQTLHYEPFSLLKRYRREPDAVTRDYLHVLLHCLLRHMFLHDAPERSLWDLACDIAVESVISGLGLEAVTAQRQNKQKTVIEDLRRQLKFLTAEKLYRHFQEQPPKLLNDLKVLFRADDHGLWYQESGFDPTAAGGRGQAEREWAELSRHVQADMEIFSRCRGEQAGGLMQNLAAVNRERYDYTSFLRKFASRGEVMKLDLDEFDYIFYTYGLKLYGNIPLIEPLEYKDVRQIREFVIAIDTSGSVKGELVQAFVQKTYNILKEAENFASRINLHIIQCDQQIREDAKITNREEFDRYLETMTLKGFGGTDFRPVFSHVQVLLRKQEFTNLKGMIYFTDGLGIYPEQKPDFDTAFVFLDEDYRDLNVPPWAMKLVLRPEEI